MALIQPEQVVDVLFPSQKERTGPETDGLKRNAKLLAKLRACKPSARLLVGLRKLMACSKPDS